MSDTADTNTDIRPTGYASRYEKTGAAIGGAVGVGAGILVAFKIAAAIAASATVLYGTWCVAGIYMLIAAVALIPNLTFRTPLFTGPLASGLSALYAVALPIMVMTGAPFGPLVQAATCVVAGAAFGAAAGRVVGTARDATAWARKRMRGTPHMQPATAAP